MPKLMSGNSSTRRVDGCRNNKPNQQSRKALLKSDTANMWVTVVELIDMQKGIAFWACAQTGGIGPTGKQNKIRAMDLWRNVVLP